MNYFIKRKQDLRYFSLLLLYFPFLHFGKKKNMDKLIFFFAIIAKKNLLIGSYKNPQMK